MSQRQSGGSGDLTEYALIIALIVIACVAAVTLLGPDVLSSAANTVRHILGR